MVVLIQWRPVISNLQGTRDPFVESPDNFFGPGTLFYARNEDSNFVGFES